ncbi:MAG: MBL fold metallo-hydrolase [Acidimicrobiia bacterium]
MIERILAPNPSLYTGPGTNTYLLRNAGEVLVIDPGPVIASHMAEILTAIGNGTAVGVIATHTHPDHAPMANPLASELGVPVYGYADGPAFAPDVRISDRDTVSFGASTIEAVHTPGHTDDHLCFQWGTTLLTGDHIMGGSTVVLEDASAYLDSLYKVQALDVERLEPGHGAAMTNAGQAITDYIEHRLMREQQILDSIGDGAGTVGEVVDVVYAGVPGGLRPAAVHQVCVQLTKLSRDAAVTFDDGHADETTSVRLR